MSADPHKATKAMAVYVQPDGQGGAVYRGDKLGRYECRNCMMFYPDGNACTVVDGRISPRGGCIMWLGGPTLDAAGFAQHVNPRRVAQAWAYDEPRNGFSCKRCRHYQGTSVTENCFRVKGWVDPDGCCDLWQERKL